MRGSAKRLHVRTHSADAWKERVKLLHVTGSRSNKSEHGLASNKEALYTTERDSVFLRGRKKGECRAAARNAVGKMQQTVRGT